MQLSMLADYPSVNVIPSFTEPIVIDTVAPVKCETCSHYSYYSDKYVNTFTVPVMATDCETWILECHEKECDDCGTIINTVNDWYHVTNNGETKCDYCYTPRPDREREIDCDCESCRPNRSGSFAAPQWHNDSLTLSSYTIGNEFVGATKAECKATDVKRMMAEFYLCEFVSANVQMYKAQSLGFNRNNIAFSEAFSVWNDAITYQNHIVATLDNLFRDYLLCAIGGELRHYYGIHGMPSGRSSSWEWFAGMAMEHGRDYMVSAALECFKCESGWNGGFGGNAWANIATVLLARERGEIDSRAFVDRVFSLQHNGGSALDKFVWQTPIYDMLIIGNAHAANRPKIGTLMQYSDRDLVRDLFVNSEGNARLSSVYIIPTYREMYGNVTRCAAYHFGYKPENVGPWSLDNWFEFNTESVW